MQLLESLDKLLNIPLFQVYLTIKLLTALLKRR